MTEQHNAEELPEPSPSRTPSFWRWALALAIPGGFVGTIAFAILGVDLLAGIGGIPQEDAGAWALLLVLGCYGLPLGVLGAGLSGLIASLLGKYAAREWGLAGALLAGILAGALGGLLVAIGFCMFVLFQ